MDDLVNTMNKMQIKEKNPYHQVIPEFVLQMINTDIEYMFMQIIHEHIDSKINTWQKTFISAGGARRNNTFH